MNSALSLPLIARAYEHGARTAVVTFEGVFTYQDLLEASTNVAARLLAGADDLHEKRVAFLIPPGLQYVAVQWGIWRSGGVAVPLAVSHPQPELEHVIDDAEVEIVVAHPDFHLMLHAIASARSLRFILTDEISHTEETILPQVELTRRAMILYTSGTTGKPKGVVMTHQNIQAQVTTLIAAWEWRSDDYILNVLPLHHVHGIINVLTCALWAGASCEILPRFDADEVWERILHGKITLFMAVPTIYAKLIAAWGNAEPERRQAMSTACARMRLMVSGSAALPVHLLKKWHLISGHVLLERYGMTECGMILSNPLHGERLPGFVGAPLPGVEVKLVAENGAPVAPGNPGEIHVKGPGVFMEYWKQPEATQRAFREGWFCTGDLAVMENGSCRILGRSSVDIIKTGGYKVSALETEEVIGSHPEVAQCTVVGVEDSVWGERVCIAIVPKAGKEPALETLRDWARTRLAPYKLPARMLVFADLPRNAMGKVLKPQVAIFFLEEE